MYTFNGAYSKGNEKCKTILNLVVLLLVWY